MEDAGGIDCAEWQCFGCWEVEDFCDSWERVRLVSRARLSDGLGAFELWVENGEAVIFTFNYQGNRLVFHSSDGRENVDADETYWNSAAMEKEFKAGGGGIELDVFYALDLKIVG